MTRRRILIVDDDASSTAPLAELLREEGYDVAVAPDGLHAMPLLGTFAPDLLLTDLRMPGMDGVSLIDRAHRVNPALPVVVMTAYGAAASKLETAYVTKPIDLAALLAALDRAFARATPLQTPA